MLEISSTVWKTCLEGVEIMEYNKNFRLRQKRVPAFDTGSTCIYTYKLFRKKGNLYI